MSKAPWEEVCFASSLHYALDGITRHVPHRETAWRRATGRELLRPQWTPNISGWGLRLAMSAKTLPHPPFHHGPRIVGEGWRDLMLLAVTEDHSPYPELDDRYRLAHRVQEAHPPRKGTPPRNAPEPEEFFPARATSVVLGMPLYFSKRRGGRRPSRDSYLLHRHSSAWHPGSEYLTPLFTLTKDLSPSPAPQSLPRDGRELLHRLLGLVKVASALYLGRGRRIRTYLSEGLPPAVVESVAFERAEAMRALNVYGSPLARRLGAHLTAPGVHWAPEAVVQQPVPAPMPPAEEEEEASEEEAASGE
jgi:hypothetical protein